MAQQIRVFSLRTVPKARAYLGVLDLLWSMVRKRDGKDGSEIAGTYTLFAPWVSWACMQAHFTQFVWYRRLFVLFSRYTFVNDLEETTPKFLMTRG